MSYETRSRVTTAPVRLPQNPAFHSARSSCLLDRDGVRDRLPGSGLGELGFPYRTRVSPALGRTSRNSISSCGGIGDVGGLNLGGGILREVFRSKGSFFRRD